MKNLRNLAYLLSMMLLLACSVPPPPPENGNTTGNTTNNNQQTVLQEQSLSFSSTRIEGEIGEERVVTVTAQGTGQIRFELVDDKIATINESGTLLFKRKGSTQLKATIAADETYAAAEAVVPVRVKPRQSALLLDATELNLSVFDEVGIVAELDRPGLLNFESDNEAVVTVDSSGNLIAQSAGSAEIRVWATETPIYAAASAKVSVNVDRVEQTLIFVKPESQLGTILGVALNNAAVSTGVSTVTYVSSNPNIATVDENGLVTPVAVGRTDITAVAPGTDQYHEKSLTYTLVVEDLNFNATTSANKVTFTWNKVDLFNEYTFFKRDKATDDFEVSFTTADAERYSYSITDTKTRRPELYFSACNAAECFTSPVVTMFGSNDIEAARAAINEVSSLQSLPNIVANQADHFETVESVHQHFNEDTAALQDSLDALLFHLQRAISGFVVKGTEGNVKTYALAAEASYPATNSDANAHMSQTLAGTIDLQEVIDIEVDPRTGDEVRTSHMAITSNNLSLVNMATGDVVQVRLYLQNPALSESGSSWQVDMLELSHEQSSKRILLLSEEDGLRLPWLFPATDEVEGSLQVDYLAEQFSSDNNQTTTLASGVLNYRADLFENSLVRKQLALQGSIGSEAALFSLDYMAPVATELKAQLLNATGYRVGDDASEWLETRDNYVTRKRIAKLSMSAETIGFDHVPTIYLTTGQNTEGISTFNWFSGASQSISFFDKPSYSFEALLTEINDGPSVTINSIEYDLTGIGSELASNSSKTYQDENAKTTIRVTWDEEQSTFFVELYFPFTDEYVSAKNFYLNPDDDVFTLTAFTYVQGENTPSIPETLAFEFRLASGANALETKNIFLDKYHQFSSAAFLPIDVKDDAYTAQVEFDFALDIKDERDNLALEQDSAIIRDIAFYSGTCDFDMQCTPLFTDFAERGVATFFQNSGTNLLQAEETDGGLLYTLSMNDKKVTVSQTYPGNLDIYKDALHLQMSTDGTVTGKVLFHDVEIGSLVVLGDQVVFDFFE